MSPESEQPELPSVPERTAEQQNLYEQMMAEVQAELAAEPTPTYNEERVRHDSWERDDADHARLDQIAMQRAERQLESIKLPAGQERFREVAAALDAHTDELSEKLDMTDDSDERAELVDRYGLRADAAEKLLKLELQRAEEAEPGVNEKLYVELVDSRLEEEWAPGITRSDWMKDALDGPRSLKNSRMNRVVVEGLYHEMDIEQMARLTESRVREVEYQLSSSWAEKEQAPPPEIHIAGHEGDRILLEPIENDPRFQDIQAQIDQLEVTSGLHDIDRRIMTAVLYLNHPKRELSYEKLRQEHTAIVADYQNLHVLRNQRQGIQGEVRKEFERRLQPIISERLQDVKQLIALGEYEKKRLSEANGKSGTYEVDIARVVAAATLDDWSGDKAGYKTPNMPEGEPMLAKDYIAELATGYLTGKYLYGKRGDLLQLYAHQTEQGETVYASGTQHRTAALKLLGRRFVEADVS